MFGVLFFLRYTILSENKNSYKNFLQIIRKLIFHQANYTCCNVGYKKKMGLGHWIEPILDWERLWRKSSQVTCCKLFE